MLKLTNRAAIALALALSGATVSSPAGAADLTLRPTLPAEPPPARNAAARPVYQADEAVYFWRSYGWPGGQAGPCWRLWYGQWVWSC